MCLRFDDFALKTALAMIFPYCWNRAWLESASKCFHVDASFEKSVFKMIRADREPSLCGEIRPPLVPFALCNEIPA